MSDEICDCCDGTGMVCKNCGAIEDDCECDSPELTDCDNCDGTGEVEVFDDEDEDEDEIEVIDDDEEEDS